MKIAFFPCTGPVGYYRMVLPALALEQQRGWKVSDYQTLYIDTNKHKIVNPVADIYSFNRWSDDQFANDRSRLQLFLRDLSTTVETNVLTADCDDWMPGMKAAHLEHQKSLTLDGKEYVASIESARSLAQMKLYSFIPHLSVTTPLLYDKFKGKPGRGVTVIPNYLHWPTWDGCDVTKEERPLTIGYYGGVHGHGKDVSILRGVIGPWLERNPGVQFFVGGDYELHDIFGIPEDRRQHHAAVAYTDIPEIVKNIDVGIIPLSDNPFNRGKSWLKGLEMNACGIPVIASPLPSYEQWIEPGVNGFLAKRTKDWIKYLDALKDPELRKEMGRKAREKAYENRIQNHVDEWESFFTKAYTT